MEPEQEDSSFRLLLGGGSVQPQETASASGCVPKAPPVADGGSVAPIGDRLKREVPSTGVPTVLAQFAPKAGQVARARRGAVRGSNLESVEQ